MTKYKWFNRWICCRLDNFHFVMAVLLGLLYVAGWITETARLKTVSCVGGFFFLLLFFLHKNLHAHYQFLTLHRKIDRIPVGQMKRVNAMFIGVFLGVMAIMMAVVPYFHPERLLMPFARLLMLLLGWIAGWFQAGQEELPSVSQERFEWGGMPDVGEYESSWLTVLLNYLEQIIGYAILLVLAWYAIHALLRLLQKILQPREFDDDEKVFLQPQFFSHEIKKEGQHREKKLWKDFSYSGRVRKYYKKRVQTRGRKKPKIPVSASPTEIEQIAGLSTEKEFLHVAYEKARYSREGCQKEDWERLPKRQGGRSGNEEG